MPKSKVAIMKDQMGWMKDSPKCGNCCYFTSDVVRKETRYGNYTEEKNKKCQKGGFVTGKSCWCSNHKFILI